MPLAVMPATIIGDCGGSDNGSGGGDSDYDTDVYSISLNKIIK